MSEDEKLMLGLFRKLLDESYADTESPSGERRLLVDGVTYDVSSDELEAMDRWYEPAR